MVTKSLVTRLFVGGIVAFIAGLVLCIVALILAFANGVFTTDGPDVTGVQPSAFSATMILLLVAGALAMLGGSIAGLVAWVGALLNTAMLEDKLWFVLLLVLGLLSFGFVAMLAYVIAGPDGTEVRRQTIAPRPV